jgi:hypothetical protein
MTSKHECNDASGKRGNYNRKMICDKTSVMVHNVPYVSLQLKFSSQFCTHVTLILIFCLYDVICDI